MNLISLMIVMMIWGSLGVFTKPISLSALSLAFLRAFIALSILFAAMRMKKSNKVKWQLLMPYYFGSNIPGIHLNSNGEDSIDGITAFIERNQAAVLL